MKNAKLTAFIFSFIIIFSLIAITVTPAYAAGIIVDTNADTLDANGSTCSGMTISDLPGSDGVTSLREAIWYGELHPRDENLRVTAFFIENDVGAHRSSSKHISLDRGVEALHPKGPGRPTKGEAEDAHAEPEDDRSREPRDPMFHHSFDERCQDHRP